VFRLPLGSPTARGKPFVNILPLDVGETITTFLPLPETEEEQDKLNLMFSTSSGTVRRNKLSDFESVRANGKIAMKFGDEEGVAEEDRESLVNVEICRDDQTVLLASAKGKAIRFPVSDIRVFTGRDSMGVRGIKLGKGDKVISMAILNGVDLDTDERDAYLKHSNAMRKLEEDGASGVDVGGLPADRIAQLGAEEEFILSVSDDGVGKRTSAYEYRVSGRGGQGVTNLELGRGKDKPDALTVATLPIESSDQVMLVTNGGTLIRTSVDEVRIAGRSTRGVWLFRVADGEKIVSLARMADISSEDEESEGSDETPDAPDESSSE